MRRFRIQNLAVRRYCRLAVVDGYYGYRRHSLRVLSSLGLCVRTDRVRRMGRRNACSKGIGIPNNVRRLDSTSWLELLVVAAL